MKRSEVISLILEERHRQVEKWGDQSGHSDEHWLAILVEEVGEVAKGMLGETGEEDGWPCPEAVRELVQVAAVAVAWLEAREDPRR